MYIISRKNITDGTQHFFQSCDLLWTGKIEKASRLSWERAEEIGCILAKAYKETDIIEILGESGRVESIVPG